VGPLLARFGLAIDGVPLGAAPILHYDEQTRHVGPQFAEAWPVIATSGAIEPSEVRYAVDGCAIVVERAAGRGKLIVIGDSWFLCDKHLEGETNFLENNVGFVRDLLFERGNVHALVAVGRDPADRVGAQTEHVARLLQPGVRLARGIDARPAGGRVHARRSTLRERRGPRGEEPDEVGPVAAAGPVPARNIVVLRKSRAASSSSIEGALPASGRPRSACSTRRMSAADS
jgi:hypothetical protein